MVFNYSLNDVLDRLGLSSQTVEGVHIHFSDNSAGEIPLKYPFKINSYLLFIIVSGEITTQMNLLDHNLSIGDVLILPPNTIVHYKEASPDFQQITINFDLDFALKTSAKHELRVAYFLIKNEIQHLTANTDQVVFLVELSKILFNKNNSTADSEILKNIIDNLFSTILLELIEIDNLNFDNNKNLKRKEIVFIKLLKLIAENFKEQKNAKFYSDKLAISISYLNKVTKELNKKTINDLINYAIITESKLLLSNQDLSISQISDSLNFSDQSAFAKFFKKHTSMSPLNYRMQIEKF